MLVRQSSLPVLPFGDGTAATGVNADFSAATDFSGTRVAYNANGNSVSVSGLTAGATYQVAVIEYNGSGTTTNYLSTISSTPVTGNAASVTTSAPSGTIFTWKNTGRTDQNWSNPNNWTTSGSGFPDGNTDIAVFDGFVSTDTVQLDMPDLTTIGGLRLINNSNVLFNRSVTGNIQLNIGGLLSGEDVDIQTGSTLTWPQGSSPFLNVALLTGNTARIAGTMIFNGTRVRFFSPDAGAIRIVSGGEIRALSSAANIFGGASGATMGGNGSVLFQAGSKYVHASTGAAPFVLGVPNAITVFQAGSIFRQESTGGLALGGRTVARYQVAGDFNVTSGTSFAFQIDTLEIEPGFSYNYSPGSGTANLILRHITANGNFTYGGNHTGTLTFAGTTNTITGSGTVSLRNVVLNSGSSLTSAAPLVATNTLTVNGTLNANGGLTLPSTAANNHVNVLGNGTINGTIAYQRFFNANAKTGYRFISSPLSGAASFSSVTNLTTTPGFLVEYNEAAGYNSGWTGAAGTMAKGKGYGYWLTDNTTLTFNGGLQMTEVGPVNLSKTDDSRPDAEEGWQLLGNPFPATIDFGLLTRTNVDDALYIWDRNTGAAGDYLSRVSGAGSASQFIAPGQGFFVKVSGAGAQNGSVTFPINARVTNTSTAYREAAKGLDLVLTDAAGYDNATMVRFHPASSEGFDSQYDAYDMRGGEATNELSSVLHDIKYSINTLPLGQGQSYDLPLAVKVGTPGRMSLSLPLNSANARVLLLDQLTGRVHDLTTGAYAFETQAHEKERRFIAYINPSAARSQTLINGDDQFFVYAVKGGVAVQFAAQKHAGATIQVLNLLGQPVATATPAAELTEIALPGAAAGYYLIQVQQTGRTTVKRVVVE